MPLSFARLKMLRLARETASCNSISRDYDNWCIKYLSEAYSRSVTGYIREEERLVHDYIVYYLQVPDTLIERSMAGLVFTDRVFCSMPSSLKCASH